MRSPNTPETTTAVLPSPVSATSPAATAVLPSTMPTTVQPVQTATVHIPQSKPRAKRMGLYDKVGQTIALGMALALALGIWLVGAKFTLDFLASMGVNLASLSYGQWLIPLAISASELWLWPKGSSIWQRWAVWLGVLLFDVGSSWAGFTEWAGGRYVPLFAGFTMPSEGFPLHGLALVLGLAFAFLPEKIGRWAVSELRTLWG